jgi:hypothetical protein
MARASTRQGASSMPTSTTVIDTAVENGVTALTVEQLTELGREMRVGGQL